MLKVKEVAKEKGVTITELAEKLGIAQVSLSRAINGNNPKLETLKKIAHALNVDVRDLIKPTKGSDDFPLYAKTSSGELVQVGSLDLEHVRAVIDTKSLNDSDL